jgi:putative salt-induced outer membrane protein YdiY
MRLGRSARSALLAVCMLAACRPVFAADTDLVVLRNGDRMHGEIKGLQYGQLQLKTTTMGTVYVEWDKIVELASPNFFEIETTDGARYYGSFEQVSPGKLGVTLEGQTTDLDVPLIVRIRPIKSSFWHRIDGSISFGASYTRSSDIGQGSISVTVGARRPKYEYSTKFDTTVTVQPDVPDKSRTAGSVSYLRLLRNRWYVPGTVMLERNTDLGLDLRASLGGGFGRYFVQTNRSLLRAGAGLVVNEENPVEGESTGNIEASLAASYSFFTYDYPKTNISTTFVLFPSLNVGGRYRTQLDVSISREIITNFTVGVTAYDSYDNKPPAGSSSSHDFGMTLSVGWTF